MKTTWEYKREIVTGHHHDLTDKLNKLGAEGWELIFYSPRPTTVEGYNSTESAVCVFKRETTTVLRD
jgi:hypothetical protein